MIAAPFWIVLFLASASATSLRSVRLNNQAVQNLQSKNYYQAYKQLLTALSEDPFDAKIHLNLGLTFQVNEESAKALQEYDVIQRLPNVEPEVRFMALFNAATVQTALGKIPEALDLYQKALELAPDSQEVKTNIELLWKGGQGQGSGKQDSKDQKDQKDQKDHKDQKDQKDPQKDQKKPDQGGQEPEKKQPQKFESQQLSPEQVRKILDELKNQEQQIRAEMNRKESKETPRDKNW